MHAARRMAKAGPRPAVETFGLERDQARGSVLQGLCEGQGTEISSAAPSLSPRPPSAPCGAAAASTHPPAPHSLCHLFLRLATAHFWSEQRLLSKHHMHLHPGCAGPCMALACCAALWVCRRAAALTRRWAGDSRQQWNHIE